MIFQVYNGAMQTTAAAVKVTTGTAVKTMQQIKPGLLPLRVVEWGYSFDGSAAATPGEIELIETGTVFGTVTANVVADVTQVDSDALLLGAASATVLAASGAILIGSTTATGFTCTSEGSISAVRNLCGPQLTAPTNQFVEQFPLGQEPIIQVGDAGRIRVTFGTAVNMYCYVKFSV